MNYAWQTEIAIDLHCEAKVRIFDTSKKVEISWTSSSTLQEISKLGPFLSQSVNSD